VPWRSSGLAARVRPQRLKAAMQKSSYSSAEVLRHPKSRSERAFRQPARALAAIRPGSLGAAFGCCVREAGMRSRRSFPQVFGDIRHSQGAGRTRNVNRQDPGLRVSCARA
jgi:hypothetical protein